MAAPMQRLIFAESSRKMLRSLSYRFYRTCSVGPHAYIIHTALPRCKFHMTNPLYSSFSHSSHACRQSSWTSNPFQQFDWISYKAPRFSVSGNRIRVLKGPKEYFETLKAQLDTCKHRVVLAALYLGTGPLEDQLVASLYDACKRCHLTNPAAPLQVDILLDCTRGSRGKHNSRTMLLPLLRNFPSDVRVSLYHTPDLRGVLKKMIPERYNEVIGLSHLKVCILDNSLIITGANLSESYFDNRQDRYVLLEDCPHVADFFYELVTAVSSFSFQLSPDDTLTLDPEFNIHPFEGDEVKFKDLARDRIQRVLDPTRWNSQTRNPAEPTHCNQNLETRTNYRKGKPRKHKNLGIEITTKEPLRGMHKHVRQFIQGSEKSYLSSTAPEVLHNCTEDGAWRTECNKSNGVSESGSKTFKHRQDVHRTNRAKSESSEEKLGENDIEDTWVFPLVQMGSFGVKVDQEVTGQILQSAEVDALCVLASGYFNLTKEYMDLVLQSKARYNILMASPKANGFYGARGISGYVPTAYTFIARNFLRKVCRRGQAERISMHEYYRQGWTFHVKGLWYNLRGETLPSLTLIGSPNFGHRSVHRDLEVQVAIVTTNENLQKQLHQEQQEFFRQSEPVNTSTFKRTDRKVPLWAKIFTTVARNFF